MARVVGDVRELPAVRRRGGNAAEIFGQGIKGPLRWRYVELRDGESGAARDRVVIATASGARACAVWRELPQLIAERWRSRFGPATIDELAAALVAVAGRIEGVLPDFMPVLAHSLMLDTARLRALPTAGAPLRTCRSRRCYRMR